MFTVYLLCVSVAHPVCDWAGLTVVRATSRPHQCGHWCTEGVLAVTHQCALRCPGRMASGTGRQPSAAAADCAASFASSEVESVLTYACDHHYTCYRNQKKKVKLKNSSGEK